MIRLITLLVALIILTACEDSHEWRQKLTLAIDTPSGPVTASTVQAIRWTGLSGAAREAVSGLQGSAGDFKITGEAAVIELAHGRYLFALLRGTGGFVGNPGENLAYALLEQRNQGGYVGTPETIALVRDLPPGQPLPLPLPPNAWPLLVTFSDITDPASVQRVDPRDLDAAFGWHANLRGWFCHGARRGRSMRHGCRKKCCGGPTRKPRHMPGLPAKRRPHSKKPIASCARTGAP